MIGLLIPTSVCSVKTLPPRPIATNSLWDHDPPPAPFPEDGRTVKRGRTGRAQPRDQEVDGHWADSGAGGCLNWGFKTRVQRSPHAWPPPHLSEHRVGDQRVSLFRHAGGRPGWLGAPRGQRSREMGCLRAVAVRPGSASVSLPLLPGRSLDTPPNPQAS